MPSPGLGLDALQALGLFIEDAFVDLATCRALVLDMQQARAVPALVRRHDKNIEDAKHRSTKIVSLPHAVGEDLHRRLQNAIPRLQHHFGAKFSSVEHPQSLRYKAGDFFRPIVTMQVLDSRRAEPRRCCFSMIRLRLKVAI